MKVPSKTTRDEKVVAGPNEESEVLMLSNSNLTNTNNYISNNIQNSQ